MRVLLVPPLWWYMGQYELRDSQALTKEEWGVQDEQVKRAWAEGIVRYAWGNGKQASNPWKKGARQDSDPLRRSMDTLRARVWPAPARVLNEFPTLTTIYYYAYTKAPLGQSFVSQESKDYSPPDFGITQIVKLESESESSLRTSGRLQSRRGTWCWSGLVVPQGEVQEGQGRLPQVKEEFKVDDIKEEAKSTDNKATVKQSANMIPKKGSPSSQSRMKEEETPSLPRAAVKQEVKNEIETSSTPARSCTVCDCRQDFRGSNEGRAFPEVSSKQEK
ncbi:hypothetical protein BKA70DRAFT_1540471 [Coprinopsis sp. MPI-PUGE-AT-0042]|nr:hypothetical protein BKA70DRAFT_1540471 [Coprinopsis sp. MPI-PUGE-AT-0042]